MGLIVSLRDRMRVSTTESKVGSVVGIVIGGIETKDVSETGRGADEMDCVILSIVGGNKYVNGTEKSEAVDVWGMGFLTSLVL
jgi:hypothetical protein